MSQPKLYEIGQKVADLMHEEGTIIAYTKRSDELNFKEQHVYLVRFPVMFGLLKREQWIVQSCLSVIERV